MLKKTLIKVLSVDHSRQLRREQLHDFERFKALSLWRRLRNFLELSKARKIDDEKMRLVIILFFIGGFWIASKLKTIFKQKADKIRLLNSR